MPEVLRIVLYLWDNVFYCEVHREEKMCVMNIFAYLKLTAEKVAFILIGKINEKLLLK